MLVFIVPLKGRHASKNWTQVCALARRTLLSLLAQDHPDFRIFLVCDEVPNGFPAHSALKIIQEKFPTPEPSNWGSRLDKWSKIRVGMAAARELAPCHIMMVDADDCVSKRLSGFSAERPNSPGWIFDDGWIHDEGSSLIFRKRHQFDEVCGSSSIVRTSRDDLSLLERAGGCGLGIGVWRSGHHDVRRHSNERGTPLEVLPFPGAIYNLGTGENTSSFSLRKWRSRKVLLKKLLGYRLLTARLRNEFGLSELSAH
jgi:hypothetical protein